MMVSKYKFIFINYNQKVNKMKQMTKYKNQK